MKRFFTFLLIPSLLIAVLFLYDQYQKNFSGARSALEAPSEDIANLIEKAEEVLPGVNNTSFPLNVPVNAKLSVFAKVAQARDLIEDENGGILVSSPNEGKVYILIDNDNDGKAEQVNTLVSGLNKPHGLALKDNVLYVGEADKVSSFLYDPTNKAASNKRVITTLSSGGNHSTRSLLFHPAKANTLLISSGSTCNVCLENSSERAAISEYNILNGQKEVFAGGLRNSVFMTVRPGTKEIWATDMGRDLLGDDTPPDEINIISEDTFYGWPYCYGKKVLDTTFDSSATAAGICSTSTSSTINLQAHSAPLGIAFLDTNTFLVAFHGSWNRSVPTGYKIVKFTLDQANVWQQADFITGWLKEDGQKLGRPVDILVAKNGKTYISDDAANVIYLLEYKD